MTVGELRRTLKGVPDDVEVAVIGSPQGWPSQPVVAKVVDSKSVAMTFIVDDEGGAHDAGERFFLIADYEPTGS